MTTLRCMIVDDEPLAREVLQNYVERMPNNLILVRKCEDALDANDVLRTEQIDLMFLDIQMPKLTGIEFLKGLKNPPQVVFTTAYSNYALDGFELNVTDYLLKPISFDRFVQAVNKAMDLHRIHAVAHEEEQFMFVKTDKKLQKINYDDILYIEGLKDYVIIRQKEGRAITLQTMKSLEDKLPADKFRRIHRSYIVAMDKITAIEGNMVEIADKHLPIGKNYRDELLELIHKNKL